MTILEKYENWGFLDNVQENKKEELSELFENFTKYLLNIVGEENLQWGKCDFSIIFITLIKKLFTEIETLEKKLSDFAYENSVKLFKKELKREIIEEAYVTKCIKKSDKKDGDGNFYPDRITTKIMKSIKTGGPDLIIEDFEENTIGIESWDDIDTKISSLITKGTPGRSIIMFRPYLVNGKLGMTIKLCAVQVDDKKKNSGSNVFTFRTGP